jgi:calcineurin-like phosphoesterase family protein
MTIRVISDTHFYHNRIIKLAKRDFPYNEDDPSVGVPVMNAHMIEAWNDTVRPGDVVYHLGDFGWQYKNFEDIEGVFNQLKGDKHLIIGNHDEMDDLRRLKWSSISIYKEIKVDDVKIVLFHYPIAEHNKVHANMKKKRLISMHMHGHVHSKPNDPFKNLNRFALDVGVDNLGYRPLPVEELILPYKALAQTLVNI